MANTHTTPFVKRMRTQGGTIYTFSSATEDIGLNINERNNIVKMSHYALLNIPSIDAPDASIQNRFNAFAIPGAFESFQNSASIKDGRVVIAESFQNYALNLECNLLDLSTYNAELPVTVSERVFWKWLKETGAIRWTDSSIANGYNYWTEEIDASYGSVVQGIGQISAGAVRNGTFGTYNETYILVPTSFGKTKAYFKQISDDNYKHDMKIPVTGSGDVRILGREDYMKPHPDGLDMLAYYDVMNSSTATGTYSMTYWDNNSMEPGWWYTYENIGAAPRSYLTDVSTSYQFQAPSTYNNFLKYTDGGTSIQFFRSRIDCMSLELNLDNLKTLYSDTALTYDDMAIKYAIDDHYDFNAVLLYYSVYNKNLDTLLATNLLGILFLDPPSGNTSNFPLSEIRLPSITKLQSGATGFGTSYSFRLNIKSDYMLDDTLAIVTDTTASQVVLEDFSQVFEGLSQSLQILNQHTGTINYITEQYLDISSSTTDMANDIADLQYQINDISRDIVGTENTIPMFIAGEDPIGDSSIFMYNGKIGLFNNKPIWPVQIDASLKAPEIYIDSAIKDISGNILLGYGSPLQVGSSTNYRGISMYTGNQKATLTMDACNNIWFGGDQTNGFLFSPMIRDTSLGSGLRWSSGYLYVDASTVAGGVTAGYVDGSLALKANYTYVDGSLATLRNYVNSTNNTLNASVGTALGNLKSYTDGSLATFKLYVDGSLNARDTSISWLNFNKSASTHNHDMVYLKEASLSDDFIWNDGYIEVSLGSIAGNLYVRKVGDTMSGALSIQNASLNVGENIYIKDTSAGNLNGIIYKETSTFIHTYRGINGSLNTAGNNTFVGINAGNLIMGNTATDVWQSSYNTALGFSALANNSTGFNNVAVGDSVLEKNIYGNGNAALGSAALNQNTSGSNNTALGNFTLFKNITNGYNVAVGANALYENTAEGNVGVGVSALGKNTTGTYNVAIGYTTLYNSSIGDRNTAIGSLSLLNLLSGNRNVVIGSNSGRYINSGANFTSGQYNTFLGAYVRPLNDGDQYEIIIGYDARGAGSNSTVIGTATNVSTYIFGNLTINNKNIFGVATPISSSDAVNKYYVDASFALKTDVCIGNAVMKTGDTMTGRLVINSSLYVNNTIEYSKLMPNDDVSRNTYIGINAGASTNSTDNTAVGYGALRYNQSHSNTVLGMNALALNQSGYQNTAIGIGALQSGTQGYENAAVGAQSLYVNIGIQNVAVGSGTFYYKVVGDRNVAIGYSAGTTRKGGLDLSTAINSIYIGARTRGGDGLNSNEIVIGTDASSRGDNTITLGNSACTSTYISGAVYLDNKVISGVATPVSASDAVNKAYVDNKVVSKTFQDLTISGSTFTWTIANGYNAKLILTTNSSINIPDVSSGDSGTLIVIQDGTGSRILQLPAGSLLNNAWTLSTTANARDIISFVYDGSNYYWNRGGPYA